MDNPDPGQPDNLDPSSTTTTEAAPAPAAFSWKSNLAADLANAPSMQKFPDTREGFNDAVKSHLSLEKLLGNEKVPIPKGPDDLAAKAIFNKAMGIPDKAEGYALADVEVPEALKGMQGQFFNKKAFQEIALKHELTTAAAKGLWESYTEMTKKSYAEAVKSQQDKVTNVINQLRVEWGDAYQSKVELGQMVINKFADNKEMNDFVTAVLTRDPNGIKFLAKIGDQFAENKIGDFKYQRHSMTPEEAQREIDVIRRDPGHPYNNDKASQAERDRAIDYVNSLISVAKRSQG